METNEELGWLIRDSSNTVRGPFSRAEISQLIKKGQLKGKTEISRANSYWFAIDEKPEVARFFPELGIAPPQEETQMTATLTQADVSGGDERGVEITQFTAMPSRAELAKGGDKPADAPKSENKIEWLSDEFADDFDAPSLEMEPSKRLDTKAPPATPAPSQTLVVPTAPPGHATPQVDHNAPTQRVDKNHPLERSSVKADTLPSELKSAKGERPKPINALMKGPDTKTSTQASNIVSVPLKDMDGQHRIISDEEEAQASEGQRARRRGIAFGLAGVVLALVIAVAGYKIATTPSTPPRVEKKRPIGDPEQALRRSMILFDLEGAKDALAELELDRRGQPMVPIAQAVMKKEFLFDADGAYMSLQTARSLAKDPKTVSEIDNLLAIYGYEREPSTSVQQLKRLADENPSQPIFRMNQAIGLLRSGKYAEASTLLTPLANLLRNDEELYPEALMLQGWSRTLASNGADTNAENAFTKALDANPANAPARLGLAIFRLRKFGMREAEADFRQFIELAPELESPSRVVNFRKMSSFELYNAARREIRELNVPGGVVGPKPSPLVMAVDAILSSIQSRTSEASKILEGAISHAPGDTNILKAVAYVRWKDGRYDDVIDLLRDLTKEKSSFAANLLLGKSYLKTGKRALAEKHFMALASLQITRGEGWGSLGELQLLQNNKADAKRHFESALTKDPRDLTALKGLNRLGDDRVLNDEEFASSLPF